MITASFRLEGDRIVGFTVKGHSGLAEEGSDVLCAAVTSVVCFCAGLTISFVYSTPVGATVVAANLAVFLAACALRLLRR